MVNNPFILLEIEPTINEKIITQAFHRLINKGGSEEHLLKLNEAYDECLQYASSERGIELFIDHHLKQYSKTAVHPS